MHTKSELKYIFSNVIEMLKYAETKNNSLTVLNVGLIIGLLANFGNLFSYVDKSVLALGLLAFSLSTCMCFVSQFPVTRVLFIKNKEMHDPNLYFFGHLAEIDLDAFTRELKIDDKNFSPDKLDIDLMKQILINSRIAQTKFKLFKIALFSTLMGIAIIGITAILSNV